MNIEARAGLITMATNRLDVSVTIRVSGRYRINSPMIPGQNSMGEKAARVVRVEPIIGYATSEVACIAASKRGAPCSM